ncbi:DNA replication and repair protein RecF [Candidatus Saccharibacteria bacterium]|nr:DNA replication and repair protein RecF [Candidatus Saccharibacteria bacterium]
MIIKTISLTNFRNHSEYHLDCNKDTTLILGKNGCGKTSVLEAIYILTRGKSFRSVDSEIIKHDADFYRIEIEYYNGEKSTATFDGKNKTFIILDKKTHRLPKKNKYPIILFLPSDLNLIGGSPSRHRDYFDRLFGQVSEEYNNLISKYNKALHQRNELLKTENLSTSDLFPWNLLLTKYGVRIFTLRQEFTEKINQTLNQTYSSIAKNDDEITLHYKTEVKKDTENFYLNMLEQNFHKDLYLGHTNFGVHRDDFEFFFNNRLADGSASRGETRSIILALKFVEANLIYEKLHQKPIVLLDDVFSELDNARRKCLIKNFKDHQVIITSVEKVSL